MNSILTSLSLFLLYFSTVGGYPFFSKHQHRQSIEDEKNNINYRFPNVAFVMHTVAHPDVIQVVNYSVNTWLYNTKLIVVTGTDTPEHHRDKRSLRSEEQHSSHRQLYQVVYNGNPGCSECASPTYKRVGKYFGAHRTMAGALIANDTFGPIDWIYIFDDDDYVNIQAVHTALSTLNSEIPLLLAGRIGPRNVKCRSLSTNTQWSCCTEVNAPCYTRINNTQLQIEYGYDQFMFQYNDTTGSLEPSPCTKLSVECCRSEPWPEGIQYGYPYRTAPEGKYRPHFPIVWPYGGATYAVSKGLFKAIGRSEWQKCLYALQCANADQRFSICTVDHGYSVTAFPALERASVHHVKTLHEFRNHVARIDDPALNALDRQYCSEHPGTCGSKK